MKSEKLFEAMSGIDEKFLEESEEYADISRLKRNNIIRMRKYLVVAACACFAIIIAVSLPNAFKMGSSAPMESTGSSYDSKSMDNAYEEAAEETAEVEEAVEGDASVCEESSAETAPASVESELNTLNLYINDENVEIAWEENEAAYALLNECKVKEPVVQMTSNGDTLLEGTFDRDYGININVETEDITAEAGDILLCDGNKLALVCKPCTASGVKLGSITGMTADEIENLMSEDAVEIRIVTE